MTAGERTGLSWTARFGAALFLLAIAAGAAALLAAAGWAWSFELGPLRVSARSARNPTIGCLVLAALAGFLLGRERLFTISRQWREGLQRLGLPLAGAATLVLVVVLFRQGAFVAGGADSSGYLNESRLWQAGSLRVPVPDIDGVTLAHGLHARAPLGFRVGAGGEHVVPTYPPGLPLLMAGFAGVFGDEAAFWVVPIAAGVMVLSAFLVGRRVGGGLVGLLAAAATAVSPTLLFEGLIPMSDVPAAAAWMTTIALLAGGSTPRTVAAAFAACVACLIRPNLFAMVPLLPLAALWWSPSWRRGLVQAAIVGAVPTMLALVFAWWQRGLYGGVTETGYGHVSLLFSLEHVVPNLRLYPAWLLYSHGLLLLLALPGALLLWSTRRSAADPTAPGAAAGRWSVLMCAALLGFYLLYVPYDNWTYTRFLLPVLPLAFSLAAVTACWIARQLPAPLHLTAIVWLLVLVPVSGVSRANSLGVFDLRNSERRYIEIADYVRQQPAGAVFVTMQHSGSLTYYAPRPQIRWDWIEPGEIDRVVRELASAGRPAYLVVDDWELPRIRERFPASSLIVRGLDAPAFSSRERTTINAFVFRLTPAAAAE